MLINAGDNCRAFVGSGRGDIKDANNVKREMAALSYAEVSDVINNEEKSNNCLRAASGVYGMKR